MLDNVLEEKPEELRVIKTSFQVNESRYHLILVSDEFGHDVLGRRQLQLRRLGSASQPEGMAPPSRRRSRARPAGLPASRA